MCAAKTEEDALSTNDNQLKEESTQKALKDEKKEIKPKEDPFDLHKSLLINFLIEKKRSIKTFNGSIATNWDSRYQYLKQGQGDFAPEVWKEAIVNRVVESIGCCESDVSLKFRFANEPNSQKNKKPSDLDKWVLGVVNPLVDRLYIYIADFCDKEYCAVGKMAKRLAQAKKADDDRRGRKRKGRLPKRKHKRRNKGKYNSSSSDSDCIILNKKPNKPSSASMWNQVMDQVSDKWSETINGTGIVEFTSLIVDHPEQYDVAVLPEAISKKHLINKPKPSTHNGGYSTSTAHHGYPPPHPAGPPAYAHSLWGGHYYHPQPVTMPHSMGSGHPSVFSGHHAASMLGPPPPPPSTMLTQPPAVAPSSMFAPTLSHSTPISQAVVHPPVVAAPIIATLPPNYPPALANTNQ